MPDTSSSLMANNQEATQTVETEIEAQASKLSQLSVTSITQETPCTAAQSETNKSQNLLKYNVQKKMKHLERLTQRIKQQKHYTGRFSVRNVNK